MQLINFKETKFICGGACTTYKFNPSTGNLIRNDKDGKTIIKPEHENYMTEFTLYVNNLDSYRSMTATVC